MKLKTQKLDLLIWLLTIVLVVWAFAYFFYKCYGASLITWTIAMGFMYKTRRVR